MFVKQCQKLEGRDPIIVSLLSMGSSSVQELSQANG
jgi:hypothetical protein